jgi:hypothetical protein
MKAKAFDTRLFKRILKFTKPINGVLGVIIFAISLSIFAALSYLWKQTVDGYIATEDTNKDCYCT